MLKSRRIVVVLVSAGLLACASHAQAESEAVVGHLAETALAAPPAGWRIVPDSARTTAAMSQLAYIVESPDGSSRRVVVGGKPSQEYSIVNEVFLSPDGSRTAFVARRRDGKQVVVTDGRETVIEGTMVSGTLQFSPDLRHHVYVTVDAKGNYRLVRDHRPEAPFWRVYRPAISPDGQRYAYMALATGRGTTAFLDGKAIGRYKAVPAELFPPPPLFSPDSARTCFILNVVVDRQGTQQGVPVVDGNALRAYDEIIGAAFSPNSQRFAFVAVSSGRSRVVVDGKQMGQAYQRIYNYLVFSPDSKRLAYAVRPKADRGCLVVDGEEGPLYDDVDVIRFSPDSSRIAYRAKRDGKWAVVVDSQAGPWMDYLAAMPVFSPDSRRLAYAGKRDDRVEIVVDGEPSELVTSIDRSSLVFSPDSRHWVCWVKVGEAWHLMIDGQLQAEAYRDVASYAAPACDSRPNTPRLTIDADGRVHAVAVSSEELAYTRVEVDL